MLQTLSVEQMPLIISHAMDLYGYSLPVYIRWVSLMHAAAVNLGIDLSQ